MSEEKQKDKVFYITHSGELLIWLIIILVFVAFNFLFFIYKEKNSENDYKIFLQDVDGLIVGSPVRMMGVEVGHVTKIKPTKNEVYVKFVITEPDITIPQGTVVTVEFSGLAGSKSLELYLPDKDTYIDSSVPLIRPNPPKRLRDSLALFNVMYKKIGSITYTCSSFGEKLDLDLSTAKPKYGLRQFLKYSDEYLDNMKEKADNYKTVIEGLRNAK